MSHQNTIYRTKYAHESVVRCFVVIILSVLTWSKRFILFEGLFHWLWDGPSAAMKRHRRMRIKVTVSVQQQQQQKWMRNACDALHQLQCFYLCQVALVYPPPPKKKKKKKKWAAYAFGYVVCEIAAMLKWVNTNHCILIQSLPKHVSKGSANNCQYGLRLRLGAEQKTSHYLNQWWLILHVCAYTRHSTLRVNVHFNSHHIVRTKPYNGTQQHA